MKKEYLEVGVIGATHGIHGMVRVEPWMDAPEDLLIPEQFYLDGGKTCLSVEEAAVYKGIVRMKFEGIQSIDEAAHLRGKKLWMNRADFLLEEGVYFLDDLLDIEVMDADSGKRYGVIAEITETGPTSNKVYHIQTEEGELLLIPAIPEVVLETDMEKGIMRIRPLEGLFELDGEQEEEGSDAL